ncbi:hypothetical protein BH11CYA1_BH11CYA1_43970 [soil metagenome]
MAEEQFRNLIVKILERNGCQVGADSIDDRMNISRNDDSGYRIRRRFF